MSRLFEKFRNAADLLLKWLAAALLGSMAFIIFLQVIYRYVFESPLAWSEEMARFLFVWVTFVGGALAANRGGHIAMTVVVDLLPTRLRSATQALGHLLTAAFFGLVALLVFQMTPILMGQVSPAMRLPMGYPYLGMMIGAGLMFIIYLGSAAGTLTGTKSDATTPDQAE